MSDTITSNYYNYKTTNHKRYIYGGSHGLDISLFLTNKFILVTVLFQIVDFMCNIYVNKVCLIHYLIVTEL